MKKRILSILLLCCMVLTMLPTTVLAADGPMDTIPKYDVSIDVYNRTSDISIRTVGATISTRPFPISSGTHGHGIRRYSSREIKPRRTYLLTA